MDHLAGGFARQRLEAGKRGGDGLGSFGQKPVGPAEHRVLFVDHRLQPAERGGEHGWYRGIAAEADDHRGFEAAQQARRLHETPAKFTEAGDPPGDPLSGDPRGAHAVGLDFRQAAGEIAAPAVGDQGQGMAPRIQIDGQGLGRKHMAAGSAGGQNHQASGGAVRPPHPNSSRLGRCRVRARTMPMLSDRAIIEEPP